MIFESSKGAKLSHTIFILLYFSDKNLFERFQTKMDVF